VVDIEHEKRELGPRIDREKPLFLEMFVEAAPVGQTSKAILARQSLKRVLGIFLRRDVTERFNDGNQRPTLVKNRTRIYRKIATAGAIR